MTNDEWNRVVDKILAEMKRLIDYTFDASESSDNRGDTFSVGIDCGELQVAALIMRRCKKG